MPKIIRGTMTTASVSGSAAERAREKPPKPVPVIGPENPLYIVYKLKPDGNLRLWKGDDIAATRAQYERAKDKGVIQLAQGYDDGPRDVPVAVAALAELKEMTVIKRDANGRKIE